MFETILFPLDQSKEAFKTATKAIELAKSHNSHIILLSVIQPERSGMNNAELIASLLATVKDQIEKAGLTCQSLERQGNPAFLICDVADDMNVDVIVMGTKGSTLEKAIESTTGRVIQLAPCPVLVVP